MRADDALKKSKRIKISGSNSTASMVGDFLTWDDTKAPVISRTLWRDDWEPVPCDCEVCEAKEYFKGTEKGTQLRNLIDNARCLNE